MPSHRLILIPGLAGDATMWSPMLPMLRAWRPVVTDVHMQHGTIEAMAAALLERHGGEPLVLCGASMGGMIAMEAARQSPDQVDAMALLGTIPHSETPQMRKVREDAIVQFREGRARDVIEANVHMAFHQDNAPALAQDYLDFVLRAGPEQLIRQNEAVMARPDARLHLPQVRCPVLVICGSGDLLAPPGCSREIAALVPEAELQIIPNCGHMLTMECPERVGELLVEWLRRL